MKNKNSGDANLVVTAPEKLPAKATLVQVPHLLLSEYKYTYTTGPFSLTSNTHSIDWGVLNNSNVVQKVRVTVFKCVTGTVKTVEPPGPLEVTLDVGETTHNANAASGGFFYEIQVECNNHKIFPYASAWDQAASPIAGTVIPSGCFIRRLP
jgi:hypothetical protein